MDKRTRKLIGFYTPEQLWAKKKLSVTDNFNRETFNKSMSEIVFQRKNRSPKFELSMCRDGLILFSDGKLEQEIAIFSDKWAIYLNYLNAIFILFESSLSNNHKKETGRFLDLFDLYEITSKNAIVIEYEDKFIKNNTYPIAKRDLELLYRPCLHSSPYSTSLLGEEVTIQQEVFDDLCDKFKGVFETRGRQREIELLSETARALSQLKSANFETSLLLVWLVTERIISKKVSEIKNQKFESFKRQVVDERIKNIEKAHISDIINVLRMVDEISFGLFEKIDSIRKKRNKIIHANKGYKCSFKDCNLAFQMLEELLNKELELELVINTSYRTKGI